MKRKLLWYTRLERHGYAFDTKENFTIEGCKITLVPYSFVYYKRIVYPSNSSKTCRYIYITSYQHVLLPINSESKSCMGRWS